jgi:MinD superfamily P-loop ATPase
VGTAEPSQTNPDANESQTADPVLEIGIISGKGGTGKTTLAASLAVLSKYKVLSDTDVDAPDLHLLLAPSIVESHPFVGGKKYRIDENACTGCGDCARACHFEAIHSLADQGNDAPRYRIEALDCEGCGLCAHICPVQAISSQDSITGAWFVSRRRFGPIAHARLEIGEENSGKLVTKVRNRASELAVQHESRCVIGDGPPGMGCPVISSVSGLDLVVIVTEPTVSGVHDLRRVLELSDHFGVPARVVINKADLNPEQCKNIKKLAGQGNAACIGEIPFDPQVHQALMQGIPLVEFGQGPAARAIQRFWRVLERAF